MKNKGKICATLAMISADGRHIEIHFTDKAEARATMDALESGVIPRQDLDRAVADIAYRLNAEHYGSKAGGLRYPDHTGLIKNPRRAAGADAGQHLHYSISQAEVQYNGRFNADYARQSR